MAIGKIVKNSHLLTEYTLRFRKDELLFKKTVFL